MSKLRPKRTAAQIQQVISDIIRRDIQDPRLQRITITEIKLDRELQHADVYVNGLGDDSREKEVLAALAKAQGYIRRELGSRLRLRNVPNLHFHWDPTLATAETIHSLLDGLEIPDELEIPDAEDINDDVDDEKDLS